MKFSLFKNYSNTFVYDTFISGPTITIFGGIHGNEIVGIKVINELLSNLEKGKIKLIKGKLIFAYGNEKAIELGKKEYKYNLNRLFKDKYINKSNDEYEIKRVKELSNILNDSDILLDIHSVSSESDPFIFSENIKNEIEIAKHIGPTKVIIGRGDISGDLLSGDTDGYMHNLNKIALTIECGRHDSIKSFNIGYNAVIKLLEYYNIIKKTNISGGNEKIDLIKMYKIKTTDTGKFLFSKGITNFKKIKKGELIGKDGTKNIFADEDFIILLPNYEETKIGEEVFYYGKNIN